MLIETQPHVPASPQFRLVNYSAHDRGEEYCDERACLCACLSARDHNYRRYCTSNLHHFLCTLPMVVARSSSGGVVIRYVLPVLWMTL